MTASRGWKKRDGFRRANRDPKNADGPWRDIAGCRLGVCCPPDCACCDCYWCTPVPKGGLVE